jgi:thioredoxin reductase
MDTKMHDVVIVGGGPAGLSAALTLGRGRKRVALFDAGPARNAAAERIHGFVTRDGTPPAEFRRIAREQLGAYPLVEASEARVDSVVANGNTFVAQAAGRTIEARRVLLCVGVIDEMPAMPGYRELWGKSIFVCPYCHGWEAQDRPFGALITSATMLEHALMFAGWSRDLIVFTNAECEVSEAARARFKAAAIRVEERKIRALLEHNGRLQAVELADGEKVAREILFARPVQSQVPLVRSLNLALDEMGYVRVDEQSRKTSVPGVHAAGDLTTMKQSAIIAAADGMLAAVAINLELTVAALTQGS